MSAGDLVVLLTSIVFLERCQSDVLCCFELSQASLLFFLAFFHCYCLYWVVSL